MKNPIGIPVLATMLLAVTAQAQSLAERFDRLDHDGDGKITASELPRTKLLERLDRNGDGVIERGELPGAAPARPRSAGTSDLEIPEEPAHTPHLDLRYDEIEGVDPNLLSLDLYVPDDEQEAKRPVMIMIHGGGWRGGDKASPAIVGTKMRHFVGSGYIYASINYRLSPQDPDEEGIKHPVHAQDCAKAIAWIHDHIAEYGGDSAQLHLTGHSAGGHLAAILGQINSHIGMIDEPMTKLIMRLHAREDASEFTGKVGQASSLSPTGRMPVLHFTRDYVPDTRDEAGEFMGGTEIMRIVAHDGKLFAGNGFWTDQPGDDPRPGATYEPVRVFDDSLDTHPFLVSTRTFDYAPWSENEVYTGGYDGAANNRQNHNSAWIFRGRIPENTP